MYKVFVMVICLSLLTIGSTAIEKEYNHNKCWNESDRLWLWNICVNETNKGKQIENQKHPNDIDNIEKFCNEYVNEIEMKHCLKKQKQPGKENHE